MESLIPSAIAYRPLQDNFCAKRRSHVPRRVLGPSASNSREGRCITVECTNIDTASLINSCFDRAPQLTSLLTTKTSTL